MSAATAEATAVERVFVRADVGRDPSPLARPAPRLRAAEAPSGRPGTTPDTPHRGTGSAVRGSGGPGPTSDVAHRDTGRTVRGSGTTSATAHRGTARAADGSGTTSDTPHRGTGSAADGSGTAHRGIEGSVRAAGPRARLVRTAEAAAPVRATGPRHVVPPTVAHRLDVLRVQDRSPVLDAADEDRGAVPAHDPGVLAGRIALATVEVLGGRRPIGQLARWLTPGVLDALQVRAALTLRVRGASGRAPQVRRVRTSAVDEHTLEAGVVVEDGAVVRAVALRLETHRGAWRATVLEVG
ncbi:hypothetical protein GXP71_09510 [Cellulomonas sp. H30R-01]|uniref:Rv3235 family protein n=1 Tax=Cellulomonas sp. H30R-01 TaxID=2704467 RepID=UPI00138D1CC3|nr:Rv3235 family protein [Cellulomonas sp. H30R-01]QHT56290.1 hypothetical protein GXP71_09510 [Cellulomonas sp. H30R-01]